MATSAAPLQNLSGLASGLDTNTIVAQLMQIERQPLMRIQQQQMVETARQNALKDVKTRLVNLQNAAEALSNAATWTDSQTVTSSDPTKVGVVRTSGAPAGGYSIGVKQLASAGQVTQTSGATTISTSGTMTITMGAATLDPTSTPTSIGVNVTAGDSLQTVADRINGSSGSPVYAAVVNNKLVLSGKNTGAGRDITVAQQDSSGNTIDDFGFASTLTAANAQYYLNDPTRVGAVKESASNTVTDGIAGLTLTLNSTTTSDVSVVVGAPGADTTKIQSQLQSFVDQYNSTIDFIQGKLKEQVVVNPQTDDDRAKGVLHGDLSLTSLLSSLRQAVSAPILDKNNATQLLSNIGLSTGAASGTINPDSVDGKLTLDTSALASALAAPGGIDTVKALFTNPTGSYDTEGLQDRFDDLLKPFTTNLTGQMDMRIASEQSQIDLMTSDEADWNDRLTNKETALRAQFTAMETALSQSQAQGQWLSGQIAQLR